MQNKRVLLGITGGIAAYKIASLIRLLIKSGAEVRCIMTPASCDFITPLTVSTLSKHPVAISFWDKKDGSWANHVEYGLWADVFVIAPLTANSLSKLVTGNSDNLLLATYLSAKCKVLVAPAMDLDMYQHPTTKRNLIQLQQDGVGVIPPTSGELASGLIGEGRMAEPETIFGAIEDFFKLSQDLKGTKVLITAGPTYEAIDPVRFIGNHSSGKMGFEIAENILNRGGEVVLVTGPTKLELEHENLVVLKVKSADEMLAAVKNNWNKCDLGVFAAAVADYRPKTVEQQKIKKKEDSLQIELVKNPDILSWAGENKTKAQFLVGFALETNDLIQNATSKLKRKNLDYIVANTLENEGAGFGHDTNQITIIDSNNNLKEFELMSKKDVANEIVNYYLNLIK